MEDGTLARIPRMPTVGVETFENLHGAQKPRRTQLSHIIWPMIAQTHSVAITPFKVIQFPQFWYRLKAHMRLPISG